MKGFWFWLIACFVASIIHSINLLYGLNRSGAFSFQLMDFIELGLIFSFGSILISVPLVIFLRLLDKKKVKPIRIVVLSNFLLFAYLYSVLTILVYFNLRNNEDSFRIILPYFISGIIFINAYFLLKKQLV
jgi:hypothetical protein